MSNNLTVNKHGVAQALTSVEAVQTYGATGGNVKWVDENEAVLKGKFITANGTYKAEDDGALGYKRVVVMSVASAGFDAPVSTKKQGIAIKEGGKGRVMNAVKKIAMQKSGSGELLMVPKPNITTKTLSVTAPGVYDIATDPDKGDAIAYSQVTVNVSDADRDAAGFNPENPTYMDNLPTSIFMYEPPLSIDHQDGEPIHTDFTVKGKDENGNIWTGNQLYPDGIIPLEELMLTPNVASFDKENEIIYSEMDTSGAPWPRFIHSTNAKEIRSYSEYGWYNCFQFDDPYGRMALLFDDGTNYERDIILCSLFPSYGKIGSQVGGDPQVPEFWSVVLVTTEYTHNGKTIFYNSRGYTGYLNNADTAKNYTVEGYGNNKALAAWSIMFGNPVIDPQTMEITVSWPRPVDGQILTTSFTIFVLPPEGTDLWLNGYGGATGGGGQTSGGGAGRND